MADISAIAEQFTNYYYSTFDTNRSQLEHLYRPTSMLTFETQNVMGVNQIMTKLNELPFKKVEHRVSTRDAQPSIHPGAIIVSVTGLLAVDDEPNPLNFSQVFQLVPDNNSYYVYNDIFRLNVG